MRYVIDHDFHIHSKISLCSKDEKHTTERIIQYAEENNLKKICLTDHFWDESIDVKMNFYEVQNYAHIEKALPLPKSDKVEFLFGSETDMDRNLRLGISKETFDKFSFVIIPTTHLHMMHFTISEQDGATPEGRARVWIERLEALLNMDLPFRKIGIAHLVCPLIAPKREEYLKVLELLPTKKLEELFKKAANLGVGIEINSFDMKFDDSEEDTVMRIFKIAKQCGCKFYLGSDAHHPNEFNGAKAAFDRAIDILDLTEEDKFHIKGE